MKPTTSNRGSILVVALAVLIVLSILAIAFARLTTLERDAAHVEVDLTQARFVAEAGLEFATQRLMNDCAQILVDSPDAAWVYGDPPEAPLETSVRPSYGKDAAGNYQAIPIAGVLHGYSGTVPPPPGSRLHPQGAHFTLKIVDLSSRLDVNDPNPNLARILDNLGEGIARYTGHPNPIRGRGSLILAHRDALPGGRFRTTRDLLSIPGFASDELEFLSEYVTPYGYRATVLQPKPQTQTDVMDFDYESTTSTLVNINTAPAPVLYSLLAGIQARCLFPNAGTYSLQTSVPIARAIAERVVNSILADRIRPVPRPVLSMYDLARRLDAELDGVPGYMPIVMASLNPNAKLTKFNSDWGLNVYGLNGGKFTRPHDRAVICDRADLLFYGFPVSFSSTGRFEITSIGRIVAEDPTHLVATYRIEQTVKLFDLMQHSTQRDFELGLSSGPSKARTYPENMPDSDPPGGSFDLDPNWASLLDGQIALDDRRSNILGAKWWTDCDIGNHRSEMNGRWSEWRWTSDVRDLGFPPSTRRADVRHNRQLYPPDPQPRSLLNEFRAPVQRTSAFKSDLHPDGFHYNHFKDDRNRILVFDSVDGEPPSTLGNAIFHPMEGRYEFWIKPDTRFRTPSDAVGGLFESFTLARSARVPSSWSGSGANHAFATNQHWRVFGWDGWLVECFFSSGIGGTIHPQARRAANWDWPLSNILWYVGAWIPDPTTFLQPMQWNHVRVQWRFYVNWEIYVNGRPIAPGGIWGGFFWGRVSTWASNVTGRMEFGLAHRQPSRFFFPSAATVDQIRAFPRFAPGGLGGVVPPHRYDPGNGWSWWESRFELPEPARILSVHYTEYPGVPAGGGGDRSYTRLRWSAGGATGDTPDRWFLPNRPAPAAIVDQYDSRLTYRVRFFDNGQTPFTQTPYVDDVTLRYSTGVEILERIEGV